MLDRGKLKTKGYVVIDEGGNKVHKSNIIYALGKAKQVRTSKINRHTYAYDMAKKYLDNPPAWANTYNINSWKGIIFRGIPKYFIVETDLDWKVVDIA